LPAVALECAMLGLVAEEEDTTGERGVGYVLKALAAGSGATAGLLAAGPVGSAIGGMGSQLAVDAVSDLLHAILARRHARAGVPLVLAAAELEMTVTDLSAKLSADPRFDQLTATCVAAAANSTVDEKLGALAKCLANGARDDALVDNETLVADALAAIEAPHLLVLEFLNQSYMDDHARPTLTSVYMELRYSKANVRPLLAALVGKALVLETPLYRSDFASDRVSALYYQLTEFGHEILARIHLAAGESDWESHNARERSQLQIERRNEFFRAKKADETEWKSTQWRKMRLAWVVVRDWIDARAWRGFGE
jgi:hypothetical protein